ncbi:hypothetical protein KBY31_10775 [Ruegeria pomeroyi]|nr:hypothetical protein [Ruegeria pomeroyi]
MSEQVNSEISSAQEILRRAISEDVPLVAILGQSIHSASDGKDSVCLAALDRIGVEGSSWSEIFSAGKLNAEFYDWLAERFERRTPSSELASISDVHFSAVFTSSIDPVLKNMFGTDGRLPEPILVGDPPPPISRSKLRPRIYYLFGMTGAGVFQPPSTRLELRARRAQHATPMLNSLFDVSTPLGVIVVAGLNAGQDWLNTGEILGHLSRAATESVLWFGPDPGFEGEDAEIFEELIDANVIIRDERSLGAVIAEAELHGSSAQLQAWNEPGIVSFDDGKRLVTTPSMRLSTEASASIIDDAWTDHLQALDDGFKEGAFSVFHSIPTSSRVLFDGVRRGFAIRRDFEDELQRVVERAIKNHSNEKGAIVVSGQSGVGKSIALFRIAASIRKKKSAAVLFARDRLPLAVELGAFLSDVDRLDHVTLLIVDALAAPRRYDTLLESFRSRGHRIVLLGSSYNTEMVEHRHEGRLVNARAGLSDVERKALVELSEQFNPGREIQDKIIASEHVLAQFFWQLPQSRSSLARGLVQEARKTERVLRDRGRSKKPVKEVGALAYALLQAGYRSEAPILIQQPEAQSENDSAGRLIDYIMACSRVHRWVPINLILRSLMSESLASQTGIDIDLVRELFEGNDLFRWRYHDNSEDQLLVGARLQLEAQLICDQRLGGAAYEAKAILELVSNATRAGPDGAEETRFVADIVYALGPDGPLGERYSESYGEIAAALTVLRKTRGVRNARLMLQEATLRRHHIRKNEKNLSDEDRLSILDEARESVEEALTDISLPSGGLKAGRRTVEYLWVERAATYGFLATSAARNNHSTETIWANYLAARQAVRNATSKSGTYFPIDISLWTALGLLESNTHFGIEQTAELKADVAATIDMVDLDELDSSQEENFQRQRLRAAELVGDLEMSDEAFNALEKVGSSVGYYFRAKNLAPLISFEQDSISEPDLRKARAAAEYLLQHRDRISDDSRCMRLLLRCLWVWKTESQMLRGLHGPLPYSDDDRNEILGVLTDLSYSTGEDLQPNIRYLIAVFRWLAGDEQSAITQFRQLSRDTEYIEGKRVLPRNVITGATREPIIFSGIVQRQIGENRWSIHVGELGRKVDLVEGGWVRDVSIGKELKFSISFNYLGPIASRPS